MEKKQIKGTDLFIDREGNVYDSNGEYITVKINCCGYRSIRLNGYDKAICYLVAIAFIPNPKSCICVKHKDGNRFNDCVDNLQWVFPFYEDDDADSKAIIKVDIDGNIVEEYSDKREAFDNYEGRYNYDNFKTEIYYGYRLDDDYFYYVKATFNRENFIEKVARKYLRKICKVDCEGNIIKEYESVTETLNVEKPQMSRTRFVVKMDGLKPTDNYWYFDTSKHTIEDVKKAIEKYFKAIENAEGKKEIKAAKTTKGKSKPIGQYTIEGELVRTWESATIAARELGYSQGNLCDCCKNGKNYGRCHGFVWKYLD